MTDDHLDQQLGIQVLAASQKGQRNIGGRGSRQNVGGPRPAGSAVFQTAYGPNEQLSATVRADAFWAAPDNAGQLAGLVPGYTHGGHSPILSAARSFRVPTRRVGTRKTASGVTFYDTLPVGEGLGRGRMKNSDQSQTAPVTLDLTALNPILLPVSDRVSARRLG